MRQRSSYPKPFKAQVVQECLQPGATLSSVAISHGINANVIRKWLPLYREQPPVALPAFVPLRAAPQTARGSVCDYRAAPWRTINHSEVAHFRP